MKLGQRPQSSDQIAMYKNSDLDFTCPLDQPPRPRLFLEPPVRDSVRKKFEDVFSLIFSSTNLSSSRLFKALVEFVISVLERRLGAEKGCHPPPRPPLLLPPFVSVTLEMLAVEASRSRQASTFFPAPGAGS